MKYGLVLEGGAMRGMFTAGVLDVFMEQGITFNGMIGVSAGACFGCNFKSHQIGRAIRYNKRFCRDRRYGYMSSYLKTGDIYDADLCYRKIPDELDPFDNDTFDKDPMDFYVVATDAKTGMPVYHKCDTLRGDAIEWIRASASMPLVSNVVEIEGRKLLDGGMADSIPLSYFKSIGYDRNVVVLTQPKEYRKKKEGLTPLMKISLREYPNLYLAMVSRPERYNENTEYIWKHERKGDTFVIAPDVKLPAKRTEHDPVILEETYQMGRNKAMEKLQSLRKFMAG